MVIIKTRPVAPIIQAVSAGSILESCANADEAASAVVVVRAMRKNARVMSIPQFPFTVLLKSVHVGLTRSNAHGALDRHDENLAIADLAGAGGGGDYFDHLVQLLAGDRDFEAELWKKIHLIFGAAIDLGVALLPAVAFHFGHRHSVNADTRERLTHLIELEWFYDSDDELHG